MYDCSLALAGYVMDEVLPPPPSTEYRIRGKEEEGKKNSKSNKNNDSSNINSTRKGEKYSDESFFFIGGEEEQELMTRCRRLRVLELGAGTGACGIIISVAAASRGIAVDTLLTDRNLAALDLAASSAGCAVELAFSRSSAIANAAAAAAAARGIKECAQQHTPTDAKDSRAVKTMCSIRTARYAFGEDAFGSILTRASAIINGGERGANGETGGGGVDQLDDVPDIIVVSDVLYAPESAAPLVSTLRQIFVRCAAAVAATNEAGAEFGGGVKTPACYLAWRPRVGNPDKMSAMRAFLVACRDEGFTVREACRRRRAAVSTATVWGDNLNIHTTTANNNNDDDDDNDNNDDRVLQKKGWCQDFDPEEERAARGLRILCVEPPPAARCRGEGPRRR